MSRSNDPGRPPSWRGPRTAAIAAAVLAIALGMWFGENDSPPAATTSSPRVEVPAVSQLAPRVDIAAAKPAALAVVEPVSACPHQRIDLNVAGNLQWACVGTTRTVQLGSVRRYELEPDGVSNWHLRIWVADGRAIAARAWAAPVRPGEHGGVFACKGSGCRAITIDEADPQGSRRLAFDGLRLGLIDPPGGAAAAPTGPARPTIQLTARLRTVPDSQVLALTCPGAAVTVLVDGGAREFCALGGAGFEIADDGHRSYQFRNLDGESLTVGLAADDAIDKVALGRRACAVPACGSVTMTVRGDPADPGSARTFTFSGTTLRDGAKPDAPNATLSGTVTMPPQN